VRRALQEIEIEWVDTIAANSIFTQCCADSRRRCVVGGFGHSLSGQAIDWEGKEGRRTVSAKAAHPNSRFTAPASQCPVLDRTGKPEGVPLSAILFGGRRPSTIPLVNEAFNWDTPCFWGRLRFRRPTARRSGRPCASARPFAMLPFCGLRHGRLFCSRLSFAERAGRGTCRKLIRELVSQGFGRKMAWPGYGDNSRVLKWICERVEGTGKACETPIGNLPTPDALDLSGLAIGGRRPQPASLRVFRGLKKEADDIAGLLREFR